MTSSTDEAVALVAGLVLSDGRRWGEVAADWQRADARAVLDLSGPRQHFITRPRGGSKTSDLAAVAIAALLEQAPPGSRSYAVAVDGDQADLITDAMRGFIQRTPGLASLLDVRARQVINRATMAALEVLPADGASAWGLRGWLYIVDELGQWPSTRNHRELWTALVSAVPKAGDTGRLVCLTSAGEPSHWSAKIIAHARTSPQWRVSETPGPVPWWTEADLAEQRALLTESQYARLILNQWTEAEDRLTTADAVEACIGHTGVLPPENHVDYAMSLDIGLTFDRTVVAVGHRVRLDDGSVRVVLDRMEVWTPSKRQPVDLIDVAVTIAELSRQYHSAPLIYDPFQAAHMAATLRDRGVRSQAFNFTAQSVGRLGMGLYRLLRDGLFDLPDDPELIDELTNVRLRESAPGTYRLDHDAGRHDDRAVALALLAHALTEARPKRRRSIVGVSTPGRD